MRIVRIAAALLLVAVAVGCGTGDLTVPESSEPSHAVSSMPAPSDEWSATPTRSEPPSTATPTLVGVLDGDSGLEGGCAWLTATGGRDQRLDDRIEPLWPEGYRTTFEGGLRLIAPGGEVVAVQGQEIAVVGSAAGDIGSICQVGTQYRVDQVLGRTN